MSTTPEQRTLIAGSHWMRVIDAANWIYHFGRVPPAGNRLEIMAGNLPSMVHSRLNRDGWIETVHRSEVWPISWSLHAYAERNGWDVRNMDKSSPRYHDLVVAYAAILQHRQDQKRTERRDFAWFIREVEQAVASAAVTGYKGFNRIDDRRVLLRFTSGAHVQGVDSVLRAWDFRTTKVHPSALDVLDRSER